MELIFRAGKTPLLRYDLNDPQALKLVKLIYQSIQADNLRFLLAVPVIRHILPEWSGWNVQREVSAKATVDNTGKM